MANTEIKRYPILATKAPDIPDSGHWSCFIFYKKVVQAFFQACRRMHMYVDATGTFYIPLILVPV